MYSALSHPPLPSMGNKPIKSIYRSNGPPIHGKIMVKTGLTGEVRQNGKLVKTDTFEIAYTQIGDKGPVILFLHGVPTNRRQWWPIQKLISPFARTISIDMLGMGDSSKPLNYGKDQSRPDGTVNNEGNKPWDWIFDIQYVDQVMNQLYPGEKFVFIADDWGSGINSHYASRLNNRLLAFIQLDPISFDGYPVSEIQAIGRASQIKDDTQFQMAMGAIDQTMVQIFKTMVHKPDDVYNQYSLRAIKHPYIDVDYERSKYEAGEDADSLSLRLKWDAIRVLADRAAILSPALLLPYDYAKNPKGVQYENITVPTLILWGEKDNMMPPMQIYRFFWAMSNSRVSTSLIKDAGHFAGTDQPERVAEEILNFLSRELGRQALADIFIGYTGIWKGDEYNMIKDLRKLYGKDEVSRGEQYLRGYEQADQVLLPTYHHNMKISTNSKPLSSMDISDTMPISNIFNNNDNISDQYQLNNFLISELSK